MTKHYCLTDNCEFTLRRSCCFGRQVPNPIFGQIRVDPNDAETIFVLGVALLKSTDGGKIFSVSRRLSNIGIPGGPVNVVLEDPFFPEILYVGTDMGVYAKIDDGALWMVPCVRLPITFVYDLALQERDRVLVAALTVVVCGRFV
jgi:hypothetical protein